MARSPIFWIETTSGLRGHFAVLISNRDGEICVEQSGIGSYENQEGAEAEGREWAQSEGISFGPPVDKPIDYSQF